VTDELATLTLIIGSAMPFDIFLFDEADTAEDLSEVTAASLIIKGSAVSPTYLLKRQTSAANLEVDADNSKLTASITQSEANGLVAGLYVGEVALKIDDEWRHTDPFYVRVVLSMAPHA